MKFDMFLMPGQDPRDAVGIARFLETQGLNGVWIGDSPPLAWGDLYCTIALCSIVTSRLGLGTGVTNPLTRDASVTANAITTVFRLSGGRATLGIGTGDSAVRALGRRSAKLATLIDYVAQVRRICLEREVTIPVYIAASGPKALAAAGRIGDGAIVSVGTHPSLVSRALDYIERGAREAGRKLADIDVVFVAGLSIADSWQEAKRETAPLAARRAKDVQYHPEFFLPPDLEHLRAEAEYVSQNYDYREHLNADASHTRFVTDGIVDAFTLAGTATRSGEKIEAMHAVGARHILLHPSGHDRRGTMERFVEAVFPRFR